MVTATYSLLVAKSEKMNFMPNQTKSSHDLQSFLMTNKLKEDTGSLHLKYPYQFDNKINKDLTHGKIWLFTPLQWFSRYNNHFDNQNKILP